jgi:hypothetical protein
VAKSKRQPTKPNQTKGATKEALLQALRSQRLAITELQNKHNQLVPVIRQLIGVATLLTDKGVLTDDEINERAETFTKRGDPIFSKDPKHSEGSGIQSKDTGAVKGDSGSEEQPILRESGNGIDRRSEDGEGEQSTKVIQMQPTKSDASSNPGDAERGGLDTLGKF